MHKITWMMAAAVCGLQAISANASLAETSFKGKTIDVIMGSAPGGGTDGTTRLVGRYLEKYLPGHPQMTYRNMPGGHGTKALNYFAKTIQPDGMTWVGGSSAHVDPNALLKPAVEYNPTKFNYFGGVSRGGSIVFINKDKLKNLTDASLKPVIVGELDGSRNWAQMIMFGQAALGWNIRFVIGYPGTSQLLLAVRRGEVDMIGTSNLKLLEEMFKTGDYVGVAQMGSSDGSGGVEGRSSFAKVPVFDDLVEGKFSGQAKEAFEFWTKLNQMDKWYALPAGTPSTIIDTYRAAFDKATKDPEFLKSARIQFSEDFTPLPGTMVSKLISTTAYPKKEITAFIEGMKAKNGLPAQPLSDEELAKLAQEKGLAGKMASVQTTLKDVKNGGRAIVFEVKGKSQSADVSSSRTQITIAGKKASRKELKPGLQCKVSYPGDKQEAATIACQ